jgi:hypothetical protein
MAAIREPAWPACLSVLLALSTAVRAMGEVVSITSSKDNTLYEDPHGAISNGSGTHLFAGETFAGFLRRGLIEFDVAGAVPPGAAIVSASLQLHMSMTATAAAVVEVHRALNEWGEGASVGFGEEGAGAPSAPGDATWLHTFFNTEFWNQPGGDFEPDASGGMVVFGNGFYTWGPTSQMTLDVQAWLDTPESNHGWLLLGEESAVQTAKRFDTHEHPDPDVRPVLTIEYIPVPEPATLILLVGGLAILVGPRCRRGLSRPVSQTADTRRG